MLLPSGKYQFPTSNKANGSGKTEICNFLNYNPKFQVGHCKFCRRTFKTGERRRMDNFRRHLKNVHADRFEFH